jgi:mycothiol system anti-sigma-R factor
MNCVDVEARLHPYVDGELPIEQMAATDAHVAACAACAALVQRENVFRRLLRQQPRESAPPELRARVAGTVRQEARRAGRRVSWLAAPALAAAAVIVGLLVPVWREPAPLVADLVNKHIAYAQLERPAELASTDRDEIAAWFQQRAGLRVTVPDYSPSGIRLIGARLADAYERRAAYLLYEKGRTLLSVFMLALPDGSALGGTPVSYRGHDYRRDERKGYHTVTWTDGRAVFGLVSSLDYEALLECADRLRLERATTTRL